MKRADKIRPVSLRYKLIISSILCLLLPAAITLTVSNLNTKSVVKQHAVDNALGTLEVMDRYIVNTVNKMLYVSNFIQFDSEIQSIIRGKWNDNRLNSEEQFVVNYFNTKKITEKLDNISFPGEKTRITILLKDGTAYSNISQLDYDPQHFFQEPWFKQLAPIPSFSTYWIGTHPSYLAEDKDEGRYFITIANTIKSFSSEPYGYLIVSLSEEQISAIFPENNTNNEHMLLDSKGTILSHPDKSRIGQSFLHFDKLEDESSPSIIKVDKEDYMLLNRKLSISDWILVSMVPYQEAISQINTVQGTNFILQGLFFAVFLLILVALMRQFTKPVFKLSRAVSQVEAGNLQFRTHIQGDDELGRLGQSFDQMLDRIEDMIQQITLEQTGKRKAELEMLQAQINPHFLFNVLNSIRLRIKLKGDEENAALISSLSSLLRMTINRNNEFIALHEEVETVAHYFKLMNFRTSEPITIHINIEPEVASVDIPRFVLQPILENSLIHGFRDYSGSISILAQKQDEHLFIQIGDTGRGMEAKELAQLHGHLTSIESSRKEELKRGLSGIGLKNVFERLRLIYGEHFHYQLASKPGQGTVITLEIPLKSGEKHA
ncbi:cache domain-containing sensor histidine kinase [Paenibacillus chungangensis]|uniref:histidine kinase n=1 Tax=Paenibacillus chungangensis TaxID=696535 RepID=A0ABW3HTP4_9BACL